VPNRGEQMVIYYGYYSNDFISCIIEQEEVVKKILKHVGLWEVKNRPLPKIHSPPGDLHTDYSNAQIPPWDDGKTSPSRTPHPKGRNI